MKLVTSSCLLLLRSSSAFLSHRASSVLATSPSNTCANSKASYSSSSSLSMSSKPFSVIVEAEIKEDRMEEFLKMIENNALKSREEPGCIRFGTL